MQMWVLRVSSVQENIIHEEETDEKDLSDYARNGFVCRDGYDESSSADGAENCGCGCGGRHWTKGADWLDYCAAVIQGSV
jgi:hypothetical protein